MKVCCVCIVSWQGAYVVLLSGTRATQQLHSCMHCVDCGGAPVLSIQTNTHTEPASVHVLFVDASAVQCV